MATTRLLRTSKTSSSLGGVAPSSSFSISHHHCNSSSFSSTITLSMRPNKAGPVGGEKKLAGSSVGERKSAVVTSAVATSENALTTKRRTDTAGGVDLAFLVLEMVKAAGIRSLKVVTRKRPWRFIVQTFIEKVILDCRFFTMFAVGGSLLGSVLCFVEGCFMIVESYLQYFHAISQGSDQGHIVHLLIEAIDMFLVGTAMLIFGTGLHMMFMGSRNLNGKGSPHLPTSNFFGLFYLRKLPSWVGIGSITEAKSKIGHALMMILQVGVLEKFKSIPMASGLDLACFAGAVFVSSACIFLLSKLSFTAASAAH